MSIITNVVGRLHVSASNREVVRAVRKALKRKFRHNYAFRRDRHSVYREAIEQHAANRKLFSDWKF